MVGILTLERRAEERDRPVRLLVIGGVLAVIGFGIAGAVGFDGHPWSGWGLVAFLLGFVIAAVGMIDLIAGALAFEFRVGEPTEQAEKEAEQQAAKKG
jgi:peptidoglycan/LPS O-acetylase OafA/YrhL